MSFELKPAIKELPEIKLVGMNLEMTMTSDRTFELWSSFMPKKRNIKEVVSRDLYSVQVFPGMEYFRQFSPDNSFVKWAAVPVSSFESVSEEFNTLLVPVGLYAVFRYKGLPAATGSFMQKIFSEWLPASEYELDNRPHMAIMGELYDNHSPDSEEDFYIPIK